MPDDAALMRRPGGVGIVFGLALGLGFSVLPAPPSADAAVQRCSNGTVALTFDDGPLPAVTPSLLDVLRAKGVPAVFFVIGSQVDADPAVVKRASDEGFVIGNHSYNHPRLTELDAAAITEELERTRQAIINAGAVPSPLMRPPFGAINDTVVSVAASLNMVPVLWDLEGFDWTGIPAAEIASNTLNQLVPHRRNIVLLHDGGAYAPETLAAVPLIIDQARAMGYCFGSIGPAGGVRAPVPRLRVSNARVRERNGSNYSFLTFVVTLSEPTSRQVSARVRTVRGTARGYSDYAPRDLRLRFPVGVTRRVVRVRVYGDNRREGNEQMTLRATDPRGLTFARRIGTGTIVDND